MLNDRKVAVRDIMNPPGMFNDGQRIREYSVKDMLPFSGKLIPEFDRRQNIQDMFRRKPTPASITEVTSTLGTNCDPQASTMLASPSSTLLVQELGDGNQRLQVSQPAEPMQTRPSSLIEDRRMGSPAVLSGGIKRRSLKTKQNVALKTATLAAAAALSTISIRGQQNLRGFLKPMASPWNST